MRFGASCQCVVVGITAREITQGCLTGTWVDVGCSFGPARTLSAVGGDHKSLMLWGNEMLVATTSVGRSFGNGCSPKEGFGRVEGFALSFPSTHERHHRRENLIQLCPSFPGQLPPLSPTHLGRISHLRPCRAEGWGCSWRSAWQQKCSTGCWLSF